jgi:glutamate racemase
MKIGVFDSGVGGLSVANAIEKAMPENEITFINDSEHLPYGDKTPEQLLGFVQPILEGLVSQGCAIIVIACNTVSTTIIDELRNLIAVPLIGIEPMIKPAVEATKSGIIAVCATPATLKSPRYKWLKDTYAKTIKVIEPDCSDWAVMIEDQQVKEEKISSNLSQALDAGADVIVLGCTHYHWINDLIQNMVAGKAKVIQPEQAIVGRLEKLIAEQTKAR